MLHLDLQTLSIATIGNLLITSFAMFIFWNLNRDLKGIRSYCGANVLMAAGFLALLLGTSPLRLPLALLAHLLLFAGSLLLLNSIRVVREFKPHSNDSDGTRHRRLRGCYCLLALRQ